MIDRIVGNASRLPFGLLLSLRSQIADRGVLSLLAVIAVAVAVSLAASVEMTSRSVRLETQRTVAAMAGPAQLEVSAGDVGVPERVVEPLRAVAGVASASAMVYQPFRIVGGPLDGQPLHLVGVDFLYEMERRGLEVSQNGVAVLDPLRLVALPDSIVIGRRLADEAGVREGDALQLTSRGKDLRVVVRGIAKSSFAEAYAGQVAAMDIFALQEVLGKTGVVDRIRVEVAEGAEPDDVAARVHEVVGPAVAVRSAGTSPVEGGNLLRAYELALWGMVAIAIATCALLCFSIASMSLTRRLEELSLLRAAGMDSRRSGRAVLTDAVLQAIVGTAVGLFVSTRVVEFVLAVLSLPLKNLRATSLEPASLSISTIAISVFAGVPTALLAAIPAAWSASQLAPLDLQARRYLPYARRATRGVRVGVILCVLVLASAALLGQGALAIAAIVAGTLLPILVVEHTLRTPSGWLERVAGRVPRIGLLIAPSLAHRRLEASLAAGVWSVIAAGLFSAATTISSYTGSLDSYFYGLMGPDAVLFITGGPPGGATFEPMQADTLAAISGDPALEDLAIFGAVMTTFRGAPVDVSSLAWDVLARRGNVDYLARDAPAAAEALRSGRALMNEAFAERFGAGEGEAIVLATPSGDETVVLGARTTEVGPPSLILPPDQFKRAFGEQRVDFVAAWFREPVGDAIRRVTRTAERQELLALHGRDARRIVLRSATRSREMLWVPVSLVSGLSVLSLLALLYGTARSRDIELALLRSSGATQANIASATAAAGVAVAVAGATIGIGVGWLWANTLCQMLSGMIGWRVTVDPSWLVAAAILVAAPLLAAAAAIPPALRAAKRARAVTAPPV